MRAAAAAGGNRGTVVNAADEVAVAAFLDGRPRRSPASRPPSPTPWTDGGATPSRTSPTIVALDAEIRAALGAELTGPS